MKAQNTKATTGKAAVKPAAKSTAKPAAAKALASAPVAPVAPVASNVTPLVTKTKIEMARAIADEIRHEGYVPLAGSSPRKDFINRCVAELEMTEKGASTYWQNLRNESSGEGLYKNAKAPTGEPRGRKPDMAGRLQKAAAKVTRLQSKVDEDMKALQAAQSELVTMATGEVPAAG
ncbi:hypothetical protein D3C75_934340 [compost metagenome]